MDKGNEDRYAALIRAAKDAAFAAAEAMDRRDLETWNQLQDRAADLRKEAKTLKSAHVRKRGKRRNSGPDDDPPGSRPAGPE